MVGQWNRDREVLSGADVESAGSELASILSYGILEHVDLVLGIPYVNGTVREDGLTVYDEQGFSDTALELKWRFYDRDGFRMALKPGITFPSGNDRKGLGSGKIGYSFFLILSDEEEPWDFHLNLGYRRNEHAAAIDERKDLWHASVAASYAVTSGVQAVANAGIETNADRSSQRAPAFVLAGIIYSPIEDLDLDIGVKKGLNRPEADLSYLAGMTVRF
jgi:hypothetical protein